MSDERIAELLAELGDAADDAADSAAAPRRATPRIAPAEAATIAAIMHGEMDRGTAARDEAIAAHGRTLACRAGCATCCETVVVTTAGESLAVARHLLDPAHRAARAAFVAAYPRWRAAVGDLADAAAAAAGRSDLPGVIAAMTEAARRRVPCAFLHDGACSVYEARPNVCRKAHALDSADACQAPVDARSPEVLYFLPIEEFMAKLAPLNVALHRAVRGPDAGAEPLCDTVHRILTDAPRASGVGRNEPCPCGSGQKYKRCCGG